MERVVVTRPILGICAMQVCAVKDATDKEILEVCNAENPAGTKGGWQTVVRKVNKKSMFMTEDHIPVVCDNDKDRLHFIILC